jgi:ubiquinone/menaquinone biosynthesis C-methylase UbiE
MAIAEPIILEDSDLQEQKETIKKAPEVLFVGGLVSDLINPAYLNMLHSVGLYDLSEQLSNLSETLGKQDNKDPRITNSDTRKLPYPNDSFDIVAVESSIANGPAEGRYKSFQEIYRVLKVGGYFIGKDLSMGTVGESVAERLHEMFYEESQRYFVEQSGAFEIIGEWKRKSDENTHRSYSFVAKKLE